MEIKNTSQNRMHIQKTDVTVTQGESYSAMLGTVVFTGGGTGGHIYPNLALIPEFERRGFKPIYIGAEGNSMEKKLAEENGIKFYGIPVIKLIRSMSPTAISNNVKIPYTLKKAVNCAKKLLEDIKPSAVFSKGGFVSLPVVMAAKKLDIPIFAHESDLTAGLANKLAKHYGAHMLKANPHSEFEGDTVGMPLREGLFGVNKADAKRRLGISSQKNVLLVLGGSSGAQFLNSEVEKHIDKLTEKYFVLHVSGRGSKAAQTSAKPSYLRFDYADNIADFYAASDVILSRAGATAVYEISALKKRAVFVPLPKGISRGDQLYNAELAEEYGGITLCQNEQFSDNFLSAIEKAIQNPPMRAISNDANRKIADIVCDSIRRGEKCKNKKQSQNGSR